jgi:hypothetical protein
LCADNEPVCEVCGTLAPVQDEEDQEDEEHLQNENLEVPACLEAEEPKDSATLEEVSVVGAAAVDTVERTTESADKAEDDSISEAELIPGTLDDAPAAGTLVKVLYDDDLWYPAMVLTSQNTVIRVRYESGKQACIDVAEHAVRLASYVEEDEGSESSDDSDGEEEKTQQQLQESSDEATNSKSDCTAEKPEQPDEDDEDSDSNDEPIPGCLDRAPCVGSFVKVLFDDDEWHRAQILRSNGVQAYVVYDDGDEEDVDFDENAIRDMDYVDEVSTSREKTSDLPTIEEKDEHEGMDNSSAQKSASMFISATVIGQKVEHDGADALLQESETY